MLIQPDPQFCKGTSAGEKDWLNFCRDNETGIESISAHFHGHAYDPHDHDELLVGITQQGLQRFSCRRAVHTSHPGRAILIEPGAVHDGHATEDEGFTYSMLYLPQVWVSDMMARRGLGDVSALEAVFRHTLTDDPLLISAIQLAFMAVHHGEGRLARDQSMDHLISLLSRHIDIRPQSFLNDSLRKIYQLRDYLHDHMSQDTGLEELSRQCGLDRFRLSRQFKNVFGQSPHAYLVRLRLRTARRLLAQGKEPVLVASLVGFSDQSHMGRWFRRAYRLSPAAYQRLCTNVLD
ncbi:MULTISPECIES: AraC family transcriptional regulator [Enterobacter]|uniref:AraC family transcriptional regulator n=1 Tax=Enterobacter TaxID=547 RepID=UPI0015B68B9E|nr:MULTISPECIES: AraC family transcriptional regulator [Enterobacter]NWJ82758.1 AraC family transcriptional regulator [Enterobacter sp. SECR19-1250]QUG52125.1 AraC family transcriptional regulator [Enterobacter cloacae]HDT2261731.1 AraC family transcriptional regulator [Enterobacter cloacae]